MTKQSGVGAGLFVDAHDLSGDIGALGSMTLSQALQDVTGMDKDGTERIPLRKDSEFSYNGFWNAAVGADVDVLTALGGGNLVTFIDGRTLGAFGAFLVANQSAFATQLGQDGSLALTGQFQSSAGRPLEWGRLLTAGKQTFASTQAVSAWTTAHAYSLNDLVQPTTPNGHYYKATTAGTSHATIEPTWPTNGSTVSDGTAVWTDQGLLPNGIDRGSGVSTAFGMAAALHVISIGSGSATVKVQDSSNRTSWADHISFAAVTTPTHEYKRTTSLTATVRRYLRVSATGSFTNLVAVVVARPYVTQQS